MLGKRSRPEASGFHLLPLIFYLRLVSVFAVRQPIKSWPRLLKPKYARGEWRYEIVANPRKQVDLFPKGIRSRRC